MNQDAQFGLIVSAIIAAIGLWPLLWGEPVRWLWLGAGLVLAASAPLMPRLWAPPRRGMQRLGIYLSRINTFVILAMVFFLILTPIALMLKLVGYDPLGIRSVRKTSTWTTRQEGWSAASFKRQF